VPKLSIITINYNNLDGLKRTVESVINQTWKEFEYLIIDGGSTDGSAAYIESQSLNFYYSISEPDKGIYNAMNKGIAKATGGYLLFLNSGDHLYNDTVLEENYNQMLDYDLIYFNLEVIGKTKTFIKNYPEKLSFSYFMKDTLPHPSTFIKSSLFGIVGLYDEDLKIVSDWKFFILALFKHNCSYLQIDTILSTYYLDGISAADTNCSLIVEDYEQFFELKNIVSNLNISRKIRMLVKLGLINKF
jgi:glycosyltransferase involved in cell wall biosynthesis